MRYRVNMVFESEVELNIEADDQDTAVERALELAKASMPPVPTRGTVQFVEEIE